jgi:hypothetical protein
LETTILTYTPLLILQVGTILLCIACAIFGITEVPTEGVTFAAADLDVESGMTVNTPSPTYTPPAPTTVAPVVIPSQTEMESQKQSVSNVGADTGAEFVISEDVPFDVEQTSKSANEDTKIDQTPIRTTQSDELHGLD